MPIIGAEAAAASAAAFLAAAIVSAYLVDWLSYTIAPAAILAVSAAAGGSIAAWLRSRAAADRSALLRFLAIVGVMFAWLLWLARPDLLPTGSGPDLAHHLALIRYIEQQWRLVHDVRLSEYLGEMIDYTPGFHLLAALAGAWLRTDGLHVAYALIASTVALKAGFVFLIARRSMPADAPRDPFALAAALLALAPRAYSIGSFTEQSYLAQVAAELFAIAMWWAAIVWDERTWPGALALFALFGMAAFLVWPVWTGPLIALLAAIIVLHRGGSPADRARAFVSAAAPIGLVALMHSAAHASGYRMAGTGGFAIVPTTAAIGWPFIAVAAPGLAAAAFDRRSRSAALFVGAIGAQAALLAAAARSSGAAAPYLAIKMFYLAIYPLSVAAAALLAVGWRAAVRREPRLGGRTPAWIAAAFIGVAAAGPAVAAPRPAPVVTEAVVRAAEWARRQTSPSCIDYLTRDGYTAYWLHLAVYGNARASGRATDDDTFEPKKALVRWILPGGLPYAIVDDFDALPRDIRTNVDVLARFGPAAVVKRRGAAASPCP